MLGAYITGNNVDEMVSGWWWSCKRPEEGFDPEVAVP